MDPPFIMSRTLVVLAIIGVIFGWNLANFIYILPTWLVGLSTGASAVYAGTLRDPNGDLLRILGMKVVSLTGLLMEINRELLISLKLRRVCHISFSIAAAFDRR